MVTLPEQNAILGAEDLVTVPDFVLGGILVLHDTKLPFAYAAVF